MPLKITRQQTQAELVTCCEIWLAAPKEEHGFVDPEFWENNYGEMLAAYLPKSVIYIAYDGEVAVGFAATIDDCLKALFVRSGGGDRASERRFSRTCSRFTGNRAWKSMQ